MPKAAVLLADVTPGFLTKLTAPYFIDAVPYHVRILILVALSASGMVLIALTPDTKDGGSVAFKLCGAVLASLSSGGGELSFLSLTHYYGHFALASWGSGTGAAGLVGAGAYVIATTTIGLSVRTSLLSFSILPVIMLISFFIVLPLGPLKAKNHRPSDYQPIVQRDEEDEEEVLVPDDEDPTLAEHEALLANTLHSRRASRTSSIESHGWVKFKANLRRASRLFFP